MAEGRIGAEGEEAHAFRLAQIDVVLVQGRNRAIQLRELTFELDQASPGVLVGPCLRGGGFHMRRDFERIVRRSQALAVAEIVAMAMHDPLARCRRQRGADRHRTEQIAQVGAMAQIGADTLPEVIEAARIPVRRLDEAAPELDTLCDEFARLRRIVEPGSVEIFAVYAGSAEICALE